MRRSFVDSTNRQASAAFRALALAACFALSGCYLKVHGTETTGAGASMATTASHANGSVKWSGGRASFSSGRDISPNAVGGQVSLGRGATAVVVLGLVIADAVSYLGSKFGPAPSVPEREAISETCSCYRKTVNSEQ